MLDKFTGHFAEFGAIMFISLIDINFFVKLGSAILITIFVLVAKYYDILNKKLDNRKKSLEIQLLENEKESIKETE
jgi:hypothetical protein